jgi:hypothetical protein
VWPIEISQFLAPNLKHHLGSELGAFEVEFEPLPTGKPDSEGTSDLKERNSTTRLAWKLNGAHHGVRPLVEIEILHFFLICLIFFRILYHQNWKHTNFSLNWTEGVAYRNSTIFRSKFKAQSRLSIRCLRSRIWASSHGQTWLGRHSRSQGKKHHNTINTKAKRSYHGVRALLEIRILPILLLFFWYFFQFYIT